MKLTDKEIACALLEKKRVRRKDWCNCWLEVGRGRYLRVIYYDFRERRKSVGLQTDDLLADDWEAVK